MVSKGGFLGMVASVIINVPSSNVDVEYEYSIPESMLPLIQIGCRVKVPFGNGDRLLMGYVLELKETISHLGQLKEITELVDLTPILSEKQIQLAKYIKEDTISPLVRVINLMVPDILKLKATKYLKILDYVSLDAKLASALGGKTIVEYTNKYSSFAGKIKKAIEKGWITLQYDAIAASPKKMVDKYELDESYYYANMDELKPYVREFLISIKEEEPLTINELVDRGEVSVYMIRKLIQRGYLHLIKVQQSRVRVREIAITDRFVKANPLYDSVVSKVQDAKKNLPILWVPKDVSETEAVIERVVRENVSKQKNTLVICPDILSSFKMASLLRKKTGLSVVCLNSTLGKGEFFDSTEEIKKNEYRIVVSTSKGCFTEYPELETVILMDAESDNYFNDQSPRYDLKKVIAEYSKIYETNYVIHSYAPNLEEYVDGIRGRFDIIDHRDQEPSLPSIEVIDLKNELLRGNNSPLSTALLRKIKLTKALNKQSLLITNRKYHSSFVMCRSCGDVIQCPRCEIALQYTKKNEQLMCPACSYRVPMPKKCPTCGEETLRFEGNGMEQVVSDLNELMPDLRVISIDEPTYDDFCEKMMDVEEEKVDVIVATDVYSRSVVDTNLNLVAVINIDEVASSPNYMASERAYHLLVHAKQKLIGKEDGKMVIQTYQPQSFYLTSFVTNEYKEYLKAEISNRKKLRNSPFYFIHRILVKGKYENVFKDANDVKKILQELLGTKIYIIGPTYNKQYQAVQLILKHQYSQINTIYKKLYEQYQGSSTTLIIDKYPRYL